jgi:hypothetical protein
MHPSRTRLSFGYFTRRRHAPFFIPSSTKFGCTSEVFMNCRSIIIFEDAEDLFDEEVGKVTQSLKVTYADRHVTTFRFDPSKGDKAFEKLSGEESPAEGYEDAGAYVIAHGGGGRFMGPLGDNAIGTQQLAAKLVWLANQGFRMKKLCFITCSAVAMIEGGKKPQPVPEELKPGVISVQTFCRVISTTDTSGKLNGLMVAGYDEGVFLTADPNHRHPIKTREGGNIKQRMRPKLDAKGLPSKLQTYANHKIVFVLENGRWRFGKLSEYSDRAEWKAALQKREL